jgi:hypothetical protein
MNNSIDININLNKNKYPELFNLSSIDDIRDELYYLINIGYSSVYKNNDINEDVENVCRKFKDDILNNFSDKNLIIRQEINNLKSNINSINIDDKINKLTSIIEDLFGISNTSNKKGEISEDFIYTLFENKFKNYCYDKKRHIPHNADGELNSPSGLKCLVEVKNYNKSVDKKEIDKFKFDLYHTNINFGLFISIKSGIIGKKNIDYEFIKHNNKTFHIVYISNTANDSVKLESSILLLESLFKFENNNNSCNDVEWIYNSVILHFKELNKLIDKTTILRDQFNIMEKNIKVNLDNYHFFLRNYESDLKIKMKEIWNNIFIQFKKSNQIIENFNDLNKLILKLNKKDKCFIIISRIIDIFRINKIGTRLNNDKFDIFDSNGTHFGFLKKFKDKVNINLHNPSINICFNYKNNNDSNYDFLNNIL